MELRLFIEAFCGQGDWMSGVADNARVGMLANQLPFRVRTLSNSVTLTSALPAPSDRFG